MIIKENKLQTHNEDSFATGFLKKLTNSSHVLFTGRAATGLYHAYTIAKLKRPEIAEPEVIVPGLSCSTAANTALLAGLKIRFADIDINTGLVSIEAIKKLINPSTVAIVFIHLFGNTENLNIFSLFCDEKGIVLIEDMAHALMPVEKNINNAGSYGDFCIFTFNVTKIIESGGGALTIKDPQDIKYLERSVENPPYKNVLDPVAKNQLALSYRNLHHQLVSFDRNDTEFQIAPFFKNICSGFLPLMWNPYFSNDYLDRDLEMLMNNFESRIQKAMIYKEGLLSNDAVTIFTNCRQGDNCWRFSFLLNNENDLVEFSEKIRKDGFHVSNLYWPPNKFFNPDDKCPNAEYAARRIVNLWVNDTVNSEYVTSCLESVKKHLAS